MTRTEFLHALDRGLRPLAASEREAILADYERYFLDGTEAGRSESEVSESLGSPARLAADLCLAHDMNAWRTSGGVRSPWRAARGILALVMLEGLLWLPVLIAVMLLVAAIATGFFAAVYGVFTLTVEVFDDPLGGVFAVVLRGIALLAAGAALLLVSNAGIYGISSLLLRVRRLRARPTPFTEVTP